MLLRCSEGKKLSMYGRENVLSSLIWKLLERGGVQFIQLMIQIILARLLTPEDFGILALLLVFINLAQVLVQGGFNIALVQKKNADNLDFSSVFYLSLFIAMVSYVFLYFTAPKIANWYSSPYLSSYLRVLSLILIPGALNSVQVAYIQKNMLFKKAALVSLLATVFSGIIGILSAFYGLGVWSLVYQQLIYSIIYCGFLWIVIKWRPLLEFSFLRIKMLMSYGLKILGSNLIYALYLDIRTLIIGHFYSPAALGFYQRGEQIPRIIVYNIDHSVETVILPTLSANQEDPIRIKSMLKRTLKTNTYIIFPMMFGLISISNNLVLILLGEQWLSTVPFLIIFSVTYSIWPLITINLQSIKALGRSDLIVKLEIFKRIVGLFIIIVTIPFGVLAITIGGFIERLFESIVNNFPNKSLIDYTYKEQIKDILPSFWQSIIMAIIIFLFNYFNMAIWVKLLLQIIVGFVIYIVFSITFNNESFVYLCEIINGKSKR